MDLLEQVQEVHRNDQMDAAPLLLVNTERAGVIQLGKEKVLERPFWGLSILKVDLKGRCGQLFF